MFSLEPVYVEIKGPDAKGVRANQRSFHSSVDGTLCYSTSAVLYRKESAPAVVLCPAAALLTFIRAEGGVEKLVPFVGIVCKFGNLSWSAELFATFEVPGVQAAVETLIGTHVRLRGHRPDKLMYIQSFAISSVATVEDGIEAVSQSAGNRSWSWDWHSSGPVHGDGYSLSQKAGIAMLVCKEGAESQLADIKCHTQEACPRPGEFLRCKSAPFGAIAPNYLHCHVSQGVVSNLMQQDSPVFLSDIDCLPGMEGAPIYNSCNSLLGMLTTPFSHTEFRAQVTVAVAAKALRGAVEIQLEKFPLTLREVPRKLPDLLSTDAHSDYSGNMKGGVQMKPAAAEGKSWRFNLLSVVAVISGTSWASGVLISTSGMVMTVAHALRRQSSSSTGSSPNQGSEVELNTLSDRCSSQHVTIGHRNTSGVLQWSSARVVYVFKGDLDLAILQICQKDVQDCYPAVLHHGPLKKGQQVNMVGHGLFSPRLGMWPSITSGNISGMVSVAAEEDCPPIMIMTTAAIYPGASGGAAFTREGRLIGIVTSNTTHGASGTTYARLNYSIAVEPLRELFKVLLQESVLTQCIAKFDLQAPELTAIWSLRTPVPHRAAKMPFVTEGQSNVLDLELTAEESRKKLSCKL